MAQSFRDLKVWQEGVVLAKDIYLMTNEFPKSELYGLTSQMRRCSVSVPANIAEGSGRGSKKDFVQFLHIAQGSLRELETYLLLCEEIGLMTSIAISPLLTQVETVGKMLLGLLRSLETSKTSNWQGATSNRFLALYPDPRDTDRLPIVRRKQATAAGHN